MSSSPSLSPSQSPSPPDERGQTTAEYALVLLVAAAVAVVAIAWAAKSGKVGELLDGVLDKILGQL